MRSDGCRACGVDREQIAADTVFGSRNLEAQTDGELNRFNLSMYVTDYKILTSPHLHKKKPSQELRIQQLRWRLHLSQCIEEAFEVLTFVACGKARLVPMAESHGYAVTERLLDAGVRVKNWCFSAASSAQDRPSDSHAASVTKLSRSVLSASTAIKARSKRWAMKKSPKTNHDGH